MAFDEEQISQLEALLNSATAKVEQSLKADTAKQVEDQVKEQMKPILETLQGILNRSEQSAAPGANGHQEAEGDPEGAMSVVMAILDRIMGPKQGNGTGFEEGIKQAAALNSAIFTHFVRPQQESMQWGMKILADSISVVSKAGGHVDLDNLPVTIAGGGQSPSQATDLNTEIIRLVKIPYAKPD